MNSLCATTRSQASWMGLIQCELFVSGAVGEIHGSMTTTWTAWLREYVDLLQKAFWKGKIDMQESKGYYTSVSTREDVRPNSPRPKPVIQGSIDVESRVALLQAKKVLSLDHF